MSLPCRLTDQIPCRRALYIKVVAATLAVGTQVTWLHYAAVDKRYGESTRVYRSSRPRPFAGTTMAHGWDVPLDWLIPVWFDAGLSRPMPLDALRHRIDHHVEACCESQDVISNGLSAATLLDVLANHHAAARGNGAVVPREVWETFAQDKLAAALAAWPEIGEADAAEIGQNLRGAFRRSFGRKFKALLDDLGMGMDSKTRRRVVDTRNSLVHDSKFPREDRAWED